MHFRTDDPQLLRELSRAEQAFTTGNIAQARVASRRAVGIAITEWARRGNRTDYPSDAMRQLHMFAGEPGLPGEVRACADRLRSRIGSDFTSPSTDPVGDAITIINYLL